LNKNETMAEVTIIIVNHNNRLHLEDCLSSLQEGATPMDCALLVVDNNSSDGSQDLIRRRFPEIELISNGENLGFARANNQAIEQSRTHFYIFLNPDTHVSTGALSMMLQEVKIHPTVDAVGPALLKGENRYQISFGRSVSFGSQVIQKCFLNPYYYLRLKRGLDKKEVGWLSGACLLVRREALERVGLFDEKFFLYFEDIDLCMRIRRSGQRLIYLPTARVFHKGGASTSLDKISSRFEYRKSQLYFYRKHNSRISLQLLRLYLALNYSLLFLFGKKSQKEEYRKFFGLIKNHAHKESR